MPQMNAKSKDKLERMQRKSSRPVARTERVARTLRPALDAPATGGRISREPHIEGERPANAPCVRKASARRAHRVLRRGGVVAATVVKRSPSRQRRHEASSQAGAEQASRPETGGRRAVGQAPWRSGRFRSASWFWSQEAAVM